jgi:hypothetical protein
MISIIGLAERYSKGKTKAIDGIEQQYCSTVKVTLPTVDLISVPATKPSRHWAADIDWPEGEGWK